MYIHVHQSIFSMSKGRSGLVSYGGDSEISDSEDERTSITMSPPGLSTIIPTNNLGIPSSRPRLVSSPPALPRPVVEAAPITMLVDYGEEDQNDSKGDNSATFDDTFQFPSEEVSEPDPETRQSPLAPSKPAIVIADEDSSHNSSYTPLFLNTRDVLLPPEVLTKCSKNLQGKIISFLQKKSTSGVDLNSSLQQRKDLRNPSIYEKLVEFCNLDELGTNYPEHLYNPKELADDSFYDNLFKEQRKEYMKKEKSKLDRTTIEFVTGTKRPPSSASSAKIETLKKPRRSKWDSGPESGGSRGASPNASRDRPLLGSGPIVMQPRVLQTGVVGAQAKAQASQLNKELSMAK